MRYSNLHNHSTYSDGKCTLEENVQSAIEKNMLSLGFSDHSFTPCDTSYCMRSEQYDAYLQEIAALKEKYKGQIPLYAGIELDYDSSVDTSLFDYTIASVHYIIKDGVVYPIDHSAAQQRDCIDNAFGGDVLAMAECYFQQLADHVEHCKPTFVGHFDVISKFGLMPEDDPAYQALAIDALARILPVCPYLEVNTGAIARGHRNQPYPARFLLDEIKKRGGLLLLGSDSHHKDNLTFWFDEAVALLKEAGFHHIHVFNGIGFDKIEL